jgi:hypothetical protein
MSAAKKKRRNFMSERSRVVVVVAELPLLPAFVSICAVETANTEGKAHRS